MSSSSPLDLRDEMQVPRMRPCPPAVRSRRSPRGPSQPASRSSTARAALDHLGDRRLVAADGLARPPVLRGERLDRLGHLRRRRPSPDVLALELGELVDLGRGFGRSSPRSDSPRRAAAALGQVHRAARRCGPPRSRARCPPSPTLSDSAGGSTGMLTCPSRFGSRSAGMPDASLPSTIATDPVRSTRGRGPRRRWRRPRVGVVRAGRARRAPSPGRPPPLPGFRTPLRPTIARPSGRAASTELPQNSTPPLPRPRRCAAACRRCRDRAPSRHEHESVRARMSSRSGRVIAATARTGCGVTVSPIRSSTPSFSSSIGMSRRGAARPAARSRGRPRVRRRLSSSAPRSSAASTTRGPSTTNTRSARRGAGRE